MHWVGNRREKVHKTVDASTVLRRAPARSGDTSWVCDGQFDRLFTFVDERVLPIVAEVVDIERWHPVVLLVVEVIGGILIGTKIRNVEAVVVAVDQRIERRDLMIVGGISFRKYGNVLVHIDGGGGGSQDITASSARNQATKRIGMPPGGGESPPNCPHQIKAHSVNDRHTMA